MSVLSRSVIAVASLAVASATLAATPATAATPSGITREQVLTAAAGLRSETPTTDQSSALNDIAKRACGVTTNDFFLSGTGATAAGGNAEGVALTAFIYAPTFRTCTIGAFATADSSFQLSGTATITSKTSMATDAPVTTQYSGALSGDVFVTPPVSTNAQYNTASAAGNATKTTSTKVIQKIKDKKTKSEKKAAKKKYDKKLKALKKTYKKALDKAGSSRSKKAAAKKTYSAKKKAAKTVYTYAIANYKLVRKTVPKTENRPFSVSADSVVLF